MTIVSSGNGMPIAVLNHNEPAFYCVPAAAYEALMELIDDAELLKLVKERANEPAVRVTLDELIWNSKKPHSRNGRDNSVENDHYIAVLKYDQSAFNNQSKPL